MKTIKVTVERKESLAFDNHQLHVKGEGAHGIIQLESRAEFDQTEIGTVLSIAGAKKEAAPKQAKSKTK